MDDRFDAFHVFLKRELDRCYQAPGDTPWDMVRLIEQICPQD